MDKLKMHSKDKTQENFEILQRLFPNAVTETITGYDEDGKAIVERAIDKDVLQQEINATVVDGREERYQFTWPDKKRAIISANAPVNKTLRPCREESVDFDNTENLYIEGDNLEVLKLLQETYLGKIKMIYIDPPYNTGHDFVYNDKFSVSPGEWDEMSGELDEYGNRLTQNTKSNGRFHTDWLNMIYPRLKLARDLLTDDGAVFISIDDNEIDNLRKVTDEVFGEDNFIAHIIHKNNSMKNQSKYIGVTTEYILVYCKNMESLNAKHGKWRTNKKGVKDVISKFQQLKDSGMDLSDIHKEIMEMYTRPKYAHLSRWNKVDEFGVFTDKDLSRSNGPKDFTIINPATGKECLIPSRGWGKSKEELLELQKNNLIWYGDGSTPPRQKSYIEESSKTVFDNFIFADTSIDKKMLNELFGKEVFEYPKPIEVIRNIITLSSDKNDFILDFFSGSATTAHAVMRQNFQDIFDGKKGKRKFIMVQLPEKTDEKSEAYKAGYKNICEIGKERIRRAGELEKKNVYATAGSSLKWNEERKAELGEDYVCPEDVDIGFRVLKLDESNMKDVYYNPADFNRSLLDTTIDNIKEDRTPEDLLFQVMLDLGVLLSSKIEETDIAGKKVFNVANGYLMACFDSDVNDETITAVAKQKPLYFVMRDSSLSTDTTATNFDQIFETYSPDTVRKVI